MCVCTCVLYQCLAVLSVDGDDAILDRTILACLLNADINNIWEITVQLQNLEKEKKRKTDIQAER